MYIVVGDDYKVPNGELYRNIESLCIKFRAATNMLIELPSHNDFIHDYIKIIKGIDCKQIKASGTSQIYSIGITLRSLLNEEGEEIKKIEDKSKD